MPGDCFSDDRRGLASLPEVGPHAGRFRGEAAVFRSGDTAADPKNSLRPAPGLVMQSTRVMCQGAQL